MLKNRRFCTLYKNLEVVARAEKGDFLHIAEEENLGDDSIYSEATRDQLLDDDELSPMEEAFMRGYDEALA